jgi:hypothetical protein
MRRAVVVLGWILAPTALAAACQESHLPLISLNKAKSHEISTHYHRAHVQGAEWGEEIPLILTISPAGSVLSAAMDPTGNPGRSAERLWNDVRPQVLQWQFSPFVRNGRPATVQAESFVDLVPPERLPARHVTPPTLRLDSQLVITLERTGCYGPCPAYIVTLRSDGSVTFDGRYYTKVKGTETAHVDPAAVRQLAQKFIDADFYSLDDSYHFAVTDSPTYVLCLSIDGHSKKVIDYVGSSVGMPDSVTDLEEAVDSVANTSPRIGSR